MLECQIHPKRWGQILISLLILAAVLVRGMEAMGCGGRCGKGTVCLGGQCQCKNRHYGLRTVPGSNVKFCSRQCETGALLCPAKTTCKEVILEGGVLKLLCECSAGSRLLSTGECQGVETDTCRERCGQGTSCGKGNRCRCQPGFHGPIAQPGIPRLFCLKRCAWGIDRCPENTTCRTVPLSAGSRDVCDCSAGAERSATGKCLNATADECEVRCGHRASCSDGRCRCNKESDLYMYYKEEYFGFCRQTCSNEADDCPDNATCRTVNLVDTGNVNLCICSAGARRSATGQCLDIDECAVNRNICGNNSICTNTVGSYKCTCAEGYKLKEGEDVGCNQDINECTESPKVCGHNSICINTKGNYTCACAEGYRQRAGEQVGCSQDIDECAVNRNICGNNSICTNTVGSYKCACVEGYLLKEGEEIGCNQDINECTEGPNVCGNNSVCTNIKGNYTCACAEGYRQRDDEMVGCSQEIDECAEIPTMCGNNSVCTNTEGNYTCACVEGYIEKEGEEVGCSQTEDCSSLTIGLLVGIGGVVLLAVIVLVVVVRARNRSRAGAREYIGLATKGKRSNVTVNAYENVPDQERVVNNLAYPGSHFPCNTDDCYQEVDLPQRKQRENDRDILYKLKPTNERPGNLQPGHGKPDVEYDTPYSAAGRNGDKVVPQTRSDQQDGSAYNELKVQRV